MAQTQPHPNPIFHLFPQLPAELRLAIWHFCLPHRVVELQHPTPDVMFNYKQPPPCKLSGTSYANRRPPVLSRVCHESRAVALETGGSLDALWSGVDGTSDDRWDHHLAQRDAWVDTRRDAVHMHYETWYDAGFGAPGSGDPLRHAARAAARTASGRASVGLGLLLLDLYTSRREFMAQLNRRPWWVVVVHTEVVHVDFACAAGTGLFGLLCDAPVQVVELCDGARVDAFYGLVRAGEEQRMDFMVELEVQRIRLESAVKRVYKDEPFTLDMRPAVAFRLCTERCDQLGRG